MYTDEQIQKYLENTQSLLKNLASRANNMWVVVCVWRSPVDGSLEHRQGWFTDFIEAEKFSNMLDATYKQLPGLKHHTYCFYNDEDSVHMVCEQLVKYYVC